jgi:hypothetical protein
MGQVVYFLIISSLNIFREYFSSLQLESQSHVDPRLPIRLSCLCLVWSGKAAETPFLFNLDSSNAAPSVDISIPRIAIPTNIRAALLDVLYHR